MNRGWWYSKRSIAWLRGDPESISFIKQIMKLLEIQGIRILLQRQEEFIDADIIVLPKRNSPEEKFFERVVSSFNGPLISEEDPVKALVYAITYPRKGFKKLIFGIDPGKECGIASIGDTLIVFVSKVDCSMVGSTIRELVKSIPAKTSEVYVGNGHGFIDAIASLSQSGIEYFIVDETGTTGASSINHVSEIVKDRDIIAGITIALRGAYGVKRINRDFYKEI